jgi:hypothetical protein
MSKLAVYMVALACTLFALARPAAAYVVEVMTSTPAAEAEGASDSALRGGERLERRGVTW